MKVFASSFFAVAISFFTLTAYAPAQTDPSDALARTEPSDTPSAKAFPKELLRNFKGLISTDNLKPFVIGAAATGVAVIPEQNIEGYFLGHPDSIERATEPGEFIGNEALVAPIVGTLFIVGRHSDDKRFQSFTYSLAQGVVIDAALTGSLKKIVGRERPNGSNYFSFPSGHTSTSFMWATVVSRTYGFKAGLPSYIAAGYVGFSRLQENAHHLTDVVAGATLGYIVGRTVTRRRDPFTPRRFTWDVAPVSGGFAASLAINPSRLHFHLKEPKRD